MLNHHCCNRESKQNSLYAFFVDPKVTTLRAYNFKTKEFKIKNFHAYSQKLSCIRSPADLVTFTEEILNGKLHFLCSVKSNKVYGIYTRIVGNVL